MTLSPQVSIVLPVYNGERFLKQAIESCLSQSLNDWELIIVDDGSTDRTAEIIAYYVHADPRISSCRHEINQYLPAALNSGFSKARGDYLTWTSDDNLFLPQTLEVMKTYLDSHPPVDIVYAGFTIIDEQGVVAEERPPLPLEGLLVNNVIGACFMYRKKVQQQLEGYRTDRFLAEDYDFWLRASHQFRIEPLYRQLYLYRRHEGSLSATRRADIFLSQEKVFLENIYKIKWCARLEKSDACLKLAVTARDNGFNGKALRHMIRGLRFSPMNVLYKMNKNISLLWRS